MNRGEMITAVQNLFGDTSEAQITKDFIISQLNAGQIDVARQTKALQVRAQTDTVIGQEGYEVPEDFIQIETLSVDGRIVPHIPRATLDSFDETRSLNGTGSVQSYYTHGRVIYLHPTPNTGVVNALDIWYIKKPAPLDQDSDICELPETFHDSVVLFALARCKELDEEFAQAQMIKVDYAAQMIENKDETYDTNGESYPAVRLLPEDY